MEGLKVNVGNEVTVSVSGHHWIYNLSITDGNKAEIATLLVSP